MGGVTRPRAMILAAGFGTRLGALTQKRPKPMLPVCGAPLIRWAVLWLREHGVREIVVNLHHRGELIEAELGDGRDLGVEIAYSREETILGTGGGLREARRLIDDGRGSPIVVLNGKILVDLDLQAVLDSHRARKAEATMVVRTDAEGTWGASLATASDGSMATFLDESRSDVESKTPVMFTGIHVLRPALLDRIPGDGEQCVVRTAYRELFSKGRIDTFHTRRYWWEHSTVPRYLAGIRNVLDGKVLLPYAETAVVGVDPTARVHPTATIRGPVFVGPGAVVEDGATVGPYAQLGARCHVETGVRVESAAVWPDARVRADVRNEVVV